MPAIHRPRLTNISYSAMQYIIVQCTIGGVPTIYGGRTMAQALHLDIPAPSKLIRSDALKGSLWTGLLQVLSNRSECKCAATVALVFFAGSIALAPALTRDQKQLAAEINTKTLKAAVAIKTSPRLTGRVHD